MKRNDTMAIKDDKEEIELLKKQIETLQNKRQNNKSIASEILGEQHKQNKRLYIIILVILSMYFVTSIAFVYYIKTTGYEEETITETVNTDNGGNACIGNNCNNGEINYGNSN